MYIDPQSITLPLALLAGILSFISPCILPLVPVYIGYLTGQAANTTSNALAAMEADTHNSTSSQTYVPRWEILLHAVFFVAGFSVIFLLLGISAGAIGLLRLGFIDIRDWLARLGGVLIIVLGLHTLKLIRIPFLYYDTRKQTAPRPELGYLGSLLMGITFSAGWTPCLGPALSALWMLGSTTGSIMRAAVLLLAYAAGLGIPFLLTALLLDRATTQLSKLHRYMRLIDIASGILLIVIGLFVLSDMTRQLAIWLPDSTSLSSALDEWLVRLAGGTP
ncbi:MAG: cytochrome c biogenesis protein CcdA [Anaerolineae bacterium]|nr:cytochrome c biogenesis protein CcdA [Anaerolineae bacterium]